MQNCLPSITWGYGHSPIFKNKCYATIVVAWGPLIQMYVLNDLRSKDEAFIADGYHILQSDLVIQDDRLEETVFINGLQEDDDMPYDYNLCDGLEGDEKNKDEAEFEEEAPLKLKRLSTIEELDGDLLILADRAYFEKSEDSC